MTRALLREHQIGDRDNLSEDEHDVLVHENLVTSGTLNFQDGTISGTGDVYATTYYGDASNLTGTSSTPESLYYNDTDIKATATAAGIEVTDGTRTASMKYVGTELVILSEQDGNFSLKGNNSSAEEKYAFKADLDGASQIFYAGTAYMYSRIGGLNVSNSGKTGSFYMSGDTMYLYNNVSGGNFTLYLNNSGTQIGLKCNSGGSADLYYAGTKVFETLVNGTSIGDGTDKISIIGAGGSTYLRGLPTGGKIYLQAYNSTPNIKNVFIGDPNGGSEVCYDGGVSIRTLATGFRWGNVDSSPGGPWVDQYVSGGISYIIAEYTGGPLELRAHNLSDVEKRILVGDPDSSTDLYYAGVKKLETTSIGALVTGRFGVNTSTPLAINDGSTSTIFHAQAALELGVSEEVGRFEGGGDADGASATVRINTNNDRGIYLEGGRTGVLPYGIIGTTTAAGSKSVSIKLTTTSTELYYAGTKRLETSTAGFIASNGSSTMQIKVDDSSTLIIRSDEISFPVLINSYNSGNNQTTLFKGDPDGAAELYYAGTKVIETFKTGTTYIMQYGNGLYDAAGTGTPEGALSGPIGCTYRRTDGGAGTSFYVKESGTGTTGWAGK